MSDAFVVLGIEPTSNREVIRTAWRTLAKTSHPDVGGSQEKMKVLNTALREALTYAETKQSLMTSSDASRETQTSAHAIRHEFGRSQRVRHDISSFTIDVLPVESFELLLITGSTLGEVIDEDCPYMIEFTLGNMDGSDHATSWCRCDLVPESGGTMVHLSVGGTTFSIETVRDEIVNCINEIAR